MTATFGDFLRPAGEHIAAAVSIHDELPAGAAFGAIGQFGRLLSTLVHYLDDLPVPDEFSAAMAAEPVSPETQTVLDTRIALRRGAQSLRYAMTTLADAVTDDSHPAVRHLSAAAGFLAAGRDLLQTHFRHQPWRHPGTPFVLGTGHYLAAGDCRPARRDREVHSPASTVDGTPVNARSHSRGRSGRHRPGSAHRQSLHMGRGSRGAGRP
jgi:hypothetical protein